jgi:hypothetical protein
MKMPCGKGAGEQCAPQNDQFGAVTDEEGASRGGDRGTAPQKFHAQQRAQWHPSKSVGASMGGIKITQNAAHGASDFIIRDQGAFLNRPVFVFSLKLHRGDMGNLTFVGAEDVSETETAVLQDAVKNFRVGHSFPPS